MRILICTNAYPPRFMGGAELVAHEQARALVRQGHEVIVFAGDFEGAGPRHGLTVDVWDGITVYRLATVPEDYDPAFLNFLHPDIDAHFVDLLQSFDPHVVHCHNLVGLSVRLPILAQENGVRVVCTLHDYWGFCLRNTLVRRDGKSCGDISRCRECLPRTDLPLRLRKDLIELALDHVDMFLMPSEYLARRYALAGVAPERIRVLPNGIDVMRFTPTDRRDRHEPVRLSYVGHFGAHKGVDTLLAALPLLRAKHDFRLSLVGQGPAEEAYRAQLEANGMADHVEFRGAIPPAEMPEFYRRTDILILPSVWNENQPVCIMEAMASGVPVVASRRGGIPELITDGDNGLLFQSGDASDLAAAVGRMIAEPDRAIAMGVRGRARIQHQTYDRQAGIQLELYRELQDRRVRAEARKPVVGILGNYWAKLRRRDRKMLWDAKRGNDYLIPVDWLTDIQKVSLPSTRQLELESKWVGRARKWLTKHPIR